MYHHLGKISLLRSTNARSLTGSLVTIILLFSLSVSSNQNTLGRVKRVTGILIISLVGYLFAHVEEIAHKTYETFTILNGEYQRNAEPRKQFK